MNDDRNLPSVRTDQLRESTADLLRRLYAQFCKKDRVLILIDPDPDAIGAALALKRILWRRVWSAAVGIIRPIRRLNNLTMVKLLNLPLTLLKKDDPDQFKSFDKYVLVDGQPHHNEFFKQFPFCAVIDHHPSQNAVEVPFVDIRSEYGSTSTIFTEYLKAAEITPSRTLATTLLYGIKTDTRNFERHTIPEDIDAFRLLFPLADHAILTKIEIADLSLRDLKHFHKAFERKHVVRERIFAHLDEVPSSDILVEIAEFFLKIHGITWSVISGTIEGDLIIVVRNSGRADAGKVVRRAFGTIGCAGGHQSMARAEIPLANMQRLLGKVSSTGIERFIRNQLSPFS